MNTARETLTACDAAHGQSKTALPPALTAKQPLLPPQLTSPVTHPVSLRAFADVATASAALLQQLGTGGEVGLKQSDNAHCEVESHVFLYAFIKLGCREDHGRSRVHYAYTMVVVQKG